MPLLTRLPGARTTLRALGIGLLCCAAAPARADAPRGWVLAGSAPSEYTTGTRAADREHRSAYLASRTEAPQGFGTLMQTIAATAWQGKRVRLSADVKTEVVSGWAGLWLRVDGERGCPIALDNMHARPLLGTRDWARATVVLDVPPDATALAFGVLLDGTGRVLMDAFRLEEVDPSQVAVTATPAESQARRPALPDAPANTDFEDAP